MKLYIDRKDKIGVLFGLLFIVNFALILSGVFRVKQQTIFVISYLYLVYFLLTIIHSDRIKYASAGMMVVYYTLIEGLGIPIANIFAPQYTQEQLARGLFFHAEYIDRYISLCLLSTAVVLLSIIIFKSGNSENTYEYDNGDYKKRRIYYWIGMVALCFFTGYMLINLLRGNFIFGDYGLYKQWSGTAIRNYSQIAFWISSVFICSSGTKRQISISLIIFMVPAVILFALGNRNDVFFPLLIGLGLYYLRFRRVPRIIIIGIIFSLLVLGPVIIQVRNGVTVSSSSVLSNVSESVGESFFELGAELHAVSNMFSWLDKGESYAYGASFILGFLSSLLRRIIPGIATYFESSRYYMYNRLPSLGFTMSAEVYYNFSTIGVIIVYALIGRFIGKYENKITNHKRLIWYGFCMLWLLILVRNSFGHSFVYVKVFLIMTLITELISYIMKYSGRKRSLHV